MYDPADYLVHTIPSPVRKRGVDVPALVAQHRAGSLREYFASIQEQQIPAREIEPLSPLSTPPRPRIRAALHAYRSGPAASVL